MDLLIMGVVTALNFILVYFKLTHKRIMDGVLDLTIFVVICGLFSSAGQAGLFVGMVSSFIVSIYLLFNPPKLGVTK